MNIFGKKNQFVEDRSLGLCEACERRYNQRLNTIQYKNMITANICDNCLKKFKRGY